MDTTTAAVIVIVIFALIGVVAFLRFRQRGSAEIQGPFGTGLRVDGSNDLPQQNPAIEAEGVLSREGGIVADDETGHGVYVRDIDAKSDVLLSSKPPPSDPKAKPPT